MVRISGSAALIFSHFLWTITIIWGPSNRNGDLISENLIFSENHWCNITLGINCVSWVQFDTMMWTIYASRFRHQTNFLLSCACRIKFHNIKGAASGNGRWKDWIEYGALLVNCVIEFCRRGNRDQYFVEMWTTYILKKYFISKIASKMPLNHTAFYYVYNFHPLIRFLRTIRTRTH